MIFQLDESGLFNFKWQSLIINNLHEYHREALIDIEVPVFSATEARNYVVCWRVLESPIKVLRSAATKFSLKGKPQV